MESQFCVDHDGIDGVTVTVTLQRQSHNRHTTSIPQVENCVWRRSQHQKKSRRRRRRKRRSKMRTYFVCLIYIANEMTYVNFVIRPAPVGVGIGKMEILILPIE